MDNQEPMVTRMGFLDVQVCVPESYTDEEIVKLAETYYPSGTTAGWQIRREGSPYLCGCKERVPCDLRPGFVHIMLDV